MMQRIRKAMNEKEQGFTLIELLVVIIIIGILAAIAIPVFLNQRKKGVDASVKSDLKNAATAAESFSTDNPTATSFATAAQTGPPAVPAVTEQAALAANGFKQSSGNKIAVKGGPSTGYCLAVFNSGASAANSATSAWYYDSLGGGLSASTTKPTGGACASATFAAGDFA